MLSGIDYSSLLLGFAGNKLVLANFANNFLFDREISANKLNKTKCFKNDVTHQKRFKDCVIILVYCTREL